MSEETKIEEILRARVINQLLEERSRIVRQISYPGQDISLKYNTEALIKILGEVPEKIKA